MRDRRLRANITGMSLANGDESALAPRLCALLGGQTDLPASITALRSRQADSTPYAAAVVRSVLTPKARSSEAVGDKPASLSVLY